MAPHAAGLLVDDRLFLQQPGGRLDRPLRKSMARAMHPEIWSMPVAEAAKRQRCSDTEGLAVDWQARRQPALLWAPASTCRREWATSQGKWYFTPEIVCSAPRTGAGFPWVLTTDVASALSRGRLIECGGRVCSRAPGRKAKIGVPGGDNADGRLQPVPHRVA
jgi:hypothetical protein